MIKSISYLVSEESRNHVSCVGGKFILTKKSKSRYTRNNTKTFTASEFIVYMKGRDPYITLETGEKLRVYRGGDPSDMVIQTISVVESHDQRFKKETIIPEYSYPEYPDYDDLF